MTWGERYDDDAPAPTFYFGCANDGFLRVVSAFHYDVGLEMPNEIERCVFGEDHHKVHAFEGGDDVSSLGVAPHGTRRSFEAAHGLIAVDADDERVSRRARGRENVYVTAVEQIEDTVRERDPALSPSSPPFGLRQCRNLRSGISRLQSPLITMGWK